ncbi:tripartite tricarboxylate transporter permease [uncultured Oscillibacter sp.]|uniref:tripartite tricarboxylate transporter permease n=1 Tax=uncultured Oscillibacter sp. TaxID=876091 RepID=UPI0025EEF297|nr:tripartite tricarboxylate transporter permease [uncultured Oscillibacter sp.]
MIQEIISNFCSIQVWIGLAVGVIGGMVVGAMPGLSGGMAIALLLPVTYSMEPVAALVMLMAIYTSAMTGGSISAILLHTPGTPANAATAIEGYPLTKQGRGLEAVGMSMLSSGIGGLSSAIALLVIAPPLAMVSLKFSEPESFLISIFGLTVIGSLSGNSILKGLLMGLVGLFLATVGMDAVTGTLRYTFGSDRLMNGIQMVPALIGLFTIAQVMSNCEDYRNANKSILEQSNVTLGKKMLPTLKELPHYAWTWIVSSVIGIVVGILPGAGGNIGSWISYDQAKKHSKHKEEFGNGSMEGLAACESGNNAVTGGSMIPLMTLSIPGSPNAAIILGGLLIQGLVPGARLFTTQAPTTYSILIGFALSNILMVFVGLAIARYVVNVTKIPNSILMPVVVSLALIGAYAINASMFDVFITIFFGLLGYLMNKFDLSSAALILGLILGGTAERGLTLSLVMAKGNVLGYYLGRPICLVLMALIVLSIAGPLVSLIRGKGKSG